jgi:uncharacterized protein (TIRG00374 family)
VKWKYLPGIVISAIFLFLAFRKVNVGDLKLALEHADYAYVIPAFLLSLVSLWVRAVRWRFLLRPVKTIGIGTLFDATAIGFMGNNLLPARLGELMRAHVIGGKEKISRSAALATIVVERVFDGFTLLLFLAVVLVVWSPGFPGWLRKASAVAVVFYICALVFLVLFTVKTEAVMRVSETIARPLPESVKRLLSRALGSFANGLAVLRSREDIVATSLLSSGSPMSPSYISSSSRSGYTCPWRCRSSCSSPFASGL